MNNQKMDIDERVQALRGLMKEQGLKAWIVNGTDPHESEYVCKRYRSREWISGFTGSAGTVIVTEEKALIWVDSRYFVQCAAQIQGTCFEMKHFDGLDCSKPVDWLKSNFSDGRPVGIAAETLMVSRSREFEKLGIKIVACEDLLDRIWEDRPQMPCNPVRRMPVKFSGESARSKVDRIRKAALSDGADNILISSLDDIAWVLNLRSCDIEDTPVFLSHLLITPDKVVLFTPEVRFEGLKNLFVSDGMPFEVMDYDDVASELSKVCGTIRFNPDRINMKLFGAIKEAVKNNGAKVCEGPEYSTAFKAAKNNTEIRGMRLAHVMDGVAMVNFLANLKSRSKRKVITEMSVAADLEYERSLEESCLSPSFSTIAGFAEHGAIVHYSATPETDKQIKGNGLLVLDSGAQYNCGTTDITRTLLFGKATKQQKEDYTLVLKGHIALATQVFPKGTYGYQLDALAHQFLWSKGLNYFHGTGHGVGFNLSVHEGPQRISVHPKTVALEKGMVISDEPGIYREGSHGIRIENLVVVTDAFKTEFGEFYSFETLTCCPYERELIVKEMLSQDEIDFVDSYHKWCYETLKDLVEPSSLSYLEQATAEL